MSQLVTVEGVDVEDTRTFAATHDPDYVYLYSEYNPDEHVGPPAVYATLAAALTASNGTAYDGPWLDATHISRYHHTPNKEWWPLHYDGDRIDANDHGDMHHFIVRAKVNA